MRYGSLPPWLARSLPAEPIEHRHAPDGLTERAIDDLLNELDLAVPVPEPQSRPVWLSADSSEWRRNRRHVRQVVRSLPSAMNTAADLDKSDEAATSSDRRWTA